MRKLEALNMILRRLGENAVTSLDVPYPTVSIALPALEEARTQLLLEEWYFNKFQWRNLLPNQYGQVAVPDDVLMAYPDNPEKYTYTGRYIVNARDGLHVDAPVLCRVITDLQFEDLPKQAQLYVVHQAAYSTYVQDFGLDDTAQSIQQDVIASYMTLGAQHTRHRKFNTRTRRTWQRYKQGLVN